ncbi:hypothetical protein ACHQM5_002992 [Ranunculus cassubicifolius]
MGYLSLKIYALVFTAWMMVFCHGITDPRDVAAINSLYVALGNPPLGGWIPNGGDPCFELWQGVECVNANITSIVLKGTNLGGELSVNLDLFSSMIVLDLSDNHIGGTLPMNLPLTLRNLFISANQFTGSIPLSLSALSQLTDMDFASNNLSGILPPSMSNLLSLTTLHLQDNQLSGMLDVLQVLPLQELNIENNLFSGPIPTNLLGIPNFKKDGNPFNTTIIPLTPPSGPVVSLPPLSGPPESGLTHGMDASGPSALEGPVQSEADSFWKSKNFIWWSIAIAAVLTVIVVGILICTLRLCKGKQDASNLPKMPKIGPGSYIRKLEDVESLDLIEKAEKPKDENGISVPKTGAYPNQRYKEKEDMKTMEVLPKSYQTNDKDTAGVDLTLISPALVPVEKLNIRPIVPTTITTGKAPLNSKLAAPVRTFTVASLQEYTNSFSQDNLIGVGTLGSVYMAELPDGKLLAVKKLDNTVLQKDDEFVDLVTHISKLQNPNLVELEGYCMEHAQKLLVYVYCSNGTLNDALLSSKQTTKNLSWNARIRIALGAARALEYLHEICHPPIVHRNFKSTNILLDDEFSVRLSDAGLAPLLSAASATQLLTSQGYSAPEFEMGAYTFQSDVYCFGVVMLELLTGRKSYDSSRLRGEQHLVRWAIPQLHDIDALVRMVDPCLNGVYPVKSLSRFADIISLCVQSEPEFRPPMSEIVQDLLHMIQREPPIRR